MPIAIHSNSNIYRFRLNCDRKISPNVQVLLISARRHAFENGRYFSNCAKLGCDLLFQQTQAPVVMRARVLPALPPAVQVERRKKVGGRASTAVRTSLSPSLPEGPGTVLAQFWVAVKWLALLLMVPPILNFGALETERRALKAQASNGTASSSMVDIGSGQNIYMQCKGEGMVNTITSSCLQATGTHPDQVEVYLKSQSRKFISPHWQVCPLS